MDSGRSRAGLQHARRERGLPGRWSRPRRRGRRRLETGSLPREAWVGATRNRVACTQGPGWSCSGRGREHASADAGYPGHGLVHAGRGLGLPGTGSRARQAWVGATRGVVASTQGVGTTSSGVARGNSSTRSLGAVLDPDRDEYTQDRPDHRRRPRPRPAHRRRPRRARPAHRRARRPRRGAAGCHGRARATTPGSARSARSGS